MTINDPHLVTGTLAWTGSERAGKVTERYVANAAYLAASAVKDGMDWQDLHRYIQGLSDMARRCAVQEAEDFAEKVLEWDDDMGKAGKYLNPEFLKN